MPTHTHTHTQLQGKWGIDTALQKDGLKMVLIGLHFQVSVFADSLIPTVRRALCDPLPQVRQVAANTFDHLHTNIGQRALDEILPYLLQQLVRQPLSLFALPICLLDTFL